MRRKSDLPLYIGQIHAFYFDTTPYTLNENVNTKQKRSTEGCSKFKGPETRQVQERLDKISLIE